MSTSILAISGSSASSSIHSTLLTLVAELAADPGAVEQVSIRDFPAPIFSVDLEKSDGIPAAIDALAQKIAAADAVILASPEHNGMVPAMLKNVIDWLSRRAPGQPFLPKPLLLLSASPGGRGGRTNLENLARLVPYWGATLVGSHSIASFRGTLQEADQQRVQELLAQLEKA